MPHPYIKQNGNGKILKKIKGKKVKKKPVHRLPPGGGAVRG